MVLVWGAQVVAVLIEGLVPGINGVYRQELTHEGWPVLKNKSGVFCCRFKEKEAWRLNRSGTFKPSSKQGVAIVAAPLGPLPVGAHDWMCCRDGGWEDQTLTLTLLVRDVSLSPCLEPRMAARESDRVLSAQRTEAEATAAEQRTREASAEFFTEHAIEALVVRTMKADKVKSFYSLVRKVEEGLPEAVALETERVGMSRDDVRKMVRKRVDSLIVREYMERDADDMNLLRYVP